MTPAPRLAVYGAAPILAALDAVGAGRPDGDQSRTARLAVVCARYAAIVADACPALTPAQWALVLDVRNGTHLLDDGDGPPGHALVAAEVEDLLEDDAWAQRHPGVTASEVRALAARLAHATVAERVAVVEIAQRWWAHPDAPTGDVGAILAAVGARVTA